MIFIDSNIWCYFLEESSKEHKNASDFLQKAIDKEQLATNATIILEISHFLVKNLGPVNGREKLDTFLEFPLFIDELNYHAVKASIDFLCQYSHEGIGGRDSTILATMKKLGIKKLVTHDKSFKNIDWVDVIDPVN